MSSVAFDLRNPGLVADELAAANGRLARERDVPVAIVELVRSLADALADLDPEQLDQDPYLLLEVEKAQVRALRALDEDDPVAERRATRLALEYLRALFERMAEDAPVSEDRPAKEIARWVASRLEVPQREIAETLEVNPRTFGRWASEQEPQAPSGEDARRLRVLARLVADLRFALTGPGVVAWLSRPRHDLGGSAPVQLLGDPDAAPRLLQLARSARSSGAG
jgi:hypothetical protein